MSRIIITGGPGAGKTTLLLALQARGYTIVGDSARAIIQDRLRRHLSPRPNADEFVHETLRMGLSTYPYYPKVFLLPPWRAIYVNDAERDHTFEHAEWVNSITQEWYHRCRYQLIELPKLSVAERCTYVLQAL